VQLTGGRGKAASGYFSAAGKAPLQVGFHPNQIAGDDVGGRNGTWMYQNSPPKMHWENVHLRHISRNVLQLAWSSHFLRNVNVLPNLTCVSLVQIQQFYPVCLVLRDKKVLASGEYQDPLHQLQRCIQHAGESLRLKVYGRLVHRLVIPQCAPERG